ncbi:hypothetical protein ADUPG1_012505 [Aduncisulcus paluster]|uniref:Clathrin/coatomer adaptor adaptin-like N-terminal domain-containing protein n=1 Tax=Aduncisulcus paluster TaxID=2918883 RepID=A0ABQ5JZP4_9EUKA|nr:hypothetical protein ADUPG1_012505 [Aduncisulcus paluster]
MFGSSSIRGLRNYIAEIRGAQSHEHEVARVNLELSKIRKKFHDSSKKLDSYNKRKYVLKLMYTFVLGYDVDFGIVEAASLMSSSSRLEKLPGYLYSGLLLEEGSEYTRLITNSLLLDLEGDVYRRSLALSFIANSAGTELAESVVPAVKDILLKAKVPTLIRKKAAMALMRLYDKYPEIVPIEDIAEDICKLVEVRNVGLLTAVYALIVRMAKDRPDLFEECVNRAIILIEKITIKQEVSGEHMYHGKPCPWLFIRICRLLRLLTPPLPGSDQHKTLCNVINHVSAGIERLQTASKSQFNTRNISYAMFFECVRLATHIQYELADPEKEHIDIATRYHKIVSVLNFSIHTHANACYIMLDCLVELSTVKELRSHLQKFIPSVTTLMESSPDVSVRKKAVDLLFHLTEIDMIPHTVERLTHYLGSKAGTGSLLMCDDVVVRAVVLCERATVKLGLVWYAVSVGRLLALSHGRAASHVWERAVSVLSVMKQWKHERRVVGELMRLYWLTRGVVRSDGASEETEEEGEKEEGEKEEPVSRKKQMEAVLGDIEYIFDGTDGAIIRKSDRGLFFNGGVDLYPLLAYLIGETISHSEEEEEVAACVRLIVDMLKIIPAKYKPVVVTCLGKLCCCCSINGFNASLMSCLKQLKQLSVCDDAEICQRCVEWAMLAKKRGVGDVCDRVPVYIKKGSQLEARLKEKARKRVEKEEIEEGIKEDDIEEEEEEKDSLDELDAMLSIGDQQRKKDEFDIDDLLAEML